jgi:hypothetical protein
MIDPLSRYAATQVFLVFLRHNFTPIERTQFYCATPQDYNPQRFVKHGFEYKKNSDKEKRPQTPHRTMTTKSA